MLGGQGTNVAVLVDSLRIPAVMIPLAAGLELERAVQQAQTLPGQPAVTFSFAANPGAKREKDFRLNTGFQGGDFTMTIGCVGGRRCSRGCWQCCLSRSSPSAAGLWASEMAP